MAVNRQVFFLEEPVQRDFGLEDIIGKLLVAQTSLKHIKEAFSNYTAMKRSVRYINIEHKWFKLNLEFIPVNLPYTEPEDISHGFENLIGQMMVTDFQIKVLRERLAGGADSKASSFDWKFNNRWFKTDIKNAVANLP
jgi:hypothetical protein